MVIKLKSKVLTITAINRSTKAKLFKTLQVGDEIELSVDIKHAGSNRGKTYATYIKTTNLATKEKVWHSFNELPRLLECFEFKESI